MRLGKNTGCALATMVAGLLSGCVPNGAARPAAQGAVTVKSIMQDVDGYASRQFSPLALPDQVRTTVANMDSQPLGFGRLILDMKVENRKPGSFDVDEYASHSTYENMGNGLVQAVDTLSANGIQVDLSIYLSYRNIIMMRAQNIALTQTYAPRVLETKTISHFDNAAASRSLSYSYATGYEGLAKTTDNQANCTFGAAFDAAELNPKISGTARNLDCQGVNANGVVTNRTHYAYLDKFGLAIPLSRENATAHITFTVTNFDAS